MSAKEMFEKLGYKKLPKKYNKNMILYEREEENPCTYAKFKVIVWFELKGKRIQFSPYYRYTLKELQAINKQVEELGWNESKGD